MKKSTFVVTLFALVAIVLTSVVPFGTNTASADQPPKFRGVMAWGNYPNHVSTLGFDTQGLAASGSGNTWDGKNPFQFANLGHVNQPVSWRNIKVQLDGAYASDVNSYWNDRVCPGTGLTFYYDIDPSSVDERYVIRMINTTGRDDLRVYWQSRHVTETYTFSGPSADLQVYVILKDEEGYERWNTCAGLVIYPR